jgi:hypothetical protein
MYRAPFLPLPRQFNLEALGSTLSVLTAFSRDEEFAEVERKRVLWRLDELGNDHAVRGFVM